MRKAHPRFHPMAEEDRLPQGATGVTLFRRPKKPQRD
jgi:hypothetical protein